MSSIGTPPTPPLALISSTAISMEALAACPHSAPFPVKGTWQPIFTLRPDSLVPCASAVDDARSTAVASAVDVTKIPASLIGTTPWKALMDRLSTTHGLARRTYSFLSPYTVARNLESCTCGQSARLAHLQVITRRAVPDRSAAPPAC